MRRVLSSLALLAMLPACAASVPVVPLATMQDLDYGGAERFTAVEGQRVAYTLTGDGPRTLVFVHPWAGDLRVWDAVAPRVGAGYRVLRIDLPGHGKSSKSNRKYDIDLAARAVSGVLAQLALPRVTLVGNSLGGGVALAVVRDHPEQVQGLVLVDALGGGPVPGLFGAFIEQFFTAPMFSGVDGGLVELFADLFVFEGSTPGNDAFMSALLSSRAAGDGYAWSRAVSSYLRTAVDYDATPWLGAIAVPTLVVWGDGDWVIWTAAGRHLRDHIPGARLVVLDDCGHMPEVDCPDALVEALGAFLAETAEVTAR